MSECVCEEKNSNNNNKKISPFRKLMFYLVGNLWFGNKTTFLSQAIKSLTTNFPGSGNNWFRVMSMRAFGFRVYVSGSAWEADAIFCGTARGFLAITHVYFLYPSRSKTDITAKKLCCLSDQD